MLPSIQEGSLPTNQWSENPGAGQKRDARISTTAIYTDASGNEEAAFAARFCDCF
jgi:hypothetical protein